MAVQTAFHTAERRKAQGEHQGEEVSRQVQRTTPDHDERSRSDGQAAPDDDPDAPAMANDEVKSRVSEAENGTQKPEAADEAGAAVKLRVAEERFRSDVSGSLPEFLPKCLQLRRSKAYRQPRHRGLRSRRADRPAGEQDARVRFCALADSFSLTPCFSWGLTDVLTRQPFQRLWAEGKPLKAVARLRPPSLTLLKQGVNERAVNTAVCQRCLLVQKLSSALRTGTVELTRSVRSGRQR